MDMKALVVDDDTLIRIFYRRALKSFGYDVKVASNASEALSILRNESFDLLVTDIKMPGMSGVDLISEIRKLKVTIPNIVICSGCHRRELPEDIWTSGLKFLQKPFSLSELRKALGIAPPVGLLGRHVNTESISERGVTNV